MYPLIKAWKRAVSYTHLDVYKRQIVDRIYIGHIPGDGALALTGVGVCMPIIMIVSAFAALVGNGGAPRATIYMGKKDNNTAEKILGNCFFTQIVISVIQMCIRDRI